MMVVVGRRSPCRFFRLKIINTPAESLSSGLALFADPSPAFILLSLRLQEVLDKVIDGERDGRRDRVLDEVEAQALEQADNTLRPPDVHQCFYHIKLAELAQR